MDRTDWDAKYAGDTLVWSAGPNIFLVSEVAGLAAGRALDLACGEGRNAVWLAEQGWAVTGVDFSAAALDKARRIAADRAVGEALTWVLADLNAYSPTPGGYDLVCLFYLQVAATERREIVRRAAAAVAPGGTLLVVGHDTANLADGVGGPRNAEVLYTPADLVADLTGLAGFAVERAETVRRPVETDDGVRDALDALVRIRRAG